MATVELGMVDLNLDWAYRLSLAFPLHAVPFLVGDLLLGSSLNENLLHQARV